MGKYFLLYCLLGFQLQSYAQSLSDQQKDSLLTITTSSQADSLRLKAHLSLVKDAYFEGDTAAFNVAIGRCEKLLNEEDKYAAEIISFHGFYYFKYEKNTLAGRDKVEESTKVYYELGMKEQMAGNYVSMGIMFKRAAIFDEALNYYFKAIHLYEELNDPRGVGNCYNNIANIFNRIEEYDKAIDYHNKALVYRKKDGAQTQMNITYLGLGLAYMDKPNFDSAEFYFKRTIEEATKIDQLNVKAIAVSSLGILYADEYGFDKALPYYEEALQIRESINDQSGIHYSKVNLGIFYLDHQLNPITEKYCLEAYSYSQQENNLFLASQSCGCLTDYYEERGDYKKAYRYLDEYKTLEDSIKSVEHQSSLIELEMANTYEKKSSQDSLEYAKQKELDDTMIELQDTELHVQENRQYLLLSGITLLVLLALFLYTRFRIIRSQKQIIEQQKRDVEHQRELLHTKNVEISDSISYARRIQEAILPSEQTLHDNLKNGFVLFKPKDIVSGDFYWLERYGNKVYVAVADCTGHGVPGAMVSVVCSTALSKALLEEHFTNPGELLDRTRELVIEKLSGSGERVKDGMDVSLAVLDQSVIDKGEGKVEWAGAHNPIWILRKQQSTIEVIKSNKQPVGYHPNPEPFTSKTIDIQKGDVIYLFSDGYQDQFGGEKLPKGKAGGKKYKASRLKDYLISINEQPMNNQEQLLNQEFEDWRGSLEQIDDVCLIGIKLG